MESIVLNDVYFSVQHYVIVKAPPCVCTEIQHEGVCQEANTGRGEAKCCICLETPPECCIFHTHKPRQCFKCYIVLPGHLARSDFL